MENIDGHCFVSVFNWNAAETSGFWYSQERHTATHCNHFIYLFVVVCVCEGGSSKSYLACTSFYNFGYMCVPLCMLQHLQQHAATSYGVGTWLKRILSAQNKNKSFDRNVYIYVCIYVRTYVHNKTI